MGEQQRTAATFGSFAGSLHLCKTPKLKARVFESVAPDDCFELREGDAIPTDVKVYGDKGILGPKRCTVDPTGIVQIIKPPKSRVVTIRWTENEPMRSLGPATVSMTTTTTYGDRHDG